MKKLRRQVAASDRDFPLSPDGSAAELNVESVSYRWPNGTLALDQCCLQIPHPGLWMLVGSNGSGKSSDGDLEYKLCSSLQAFRSAAGQFHIIVGKTDHAKANGD